MKYKPNYSHQKEGTYFGVREEEKYQILSFVYVFEKIYNPSVHSGYQDQTI